ncbi:MAG: tetratricopeptide repeat protein [Prevotella sp.]|nr:tetratricopeptide repeat protein [Prevotella sp.]MBR1556404.1 tetratricopeptide repeat protein [Prevotella sp.]
MKRLSLAILILNFTFITSYAQSVDSLRNKALYWAERGYYARSLDMISQIPSDSLCINDMRMHYDALSNLGHEDSLEYWADRILRQDPYCTPVIIDYTRRLNRGLKTETGQVRNSDRVIEICAQYKQRDSTHILINRQLADAYYNMGNFDRALPELKRLVEMGDTCFSTLYTLGLTYQRMGDNSSAYDHLYHAYLKNDHHAYCLFTLGIVCNKMGLGGEALSYLDEAKKLMIPDRRTLYRLHRELADAFQHKNEADFRLEELKECVKYANDDELPLLDYEMGQCLVSLKQLDKAQEHLQRFLNATENREYNDKIKYKRQSAQQALRMMMW